ncbi:MAG: rhomboid family protein [Lentisphaeria bacterium]|jgi:hypothetical protein|nr:rhomboid family protein [Lentisphaeria bacterium]MDP7740931.1 rhomboid family protein [Lentisphaeria bacterium]
MSDHLDCRNHAGRKVVAHCRHCTQALCRECVTEHNNRMLCENCLRGVSQPVAAESKRRNAAIAAVAAAGCLLLWLFFLATGQILAHAPSVFHRFVPW